MMSLLALALGYYAAALLFYWTPLWAARRKNAALPPDPSGAAALPVLVAIAPCRNAAGAIAGMAACLKKQDYPADRRRLFMAIDRAGASDRSADIARACGVEVYERIDPPVRTKGAAINELLENRLKREPWDALLILDIDARLEPHFFRRVAAYLQAGAQAIQCAPASKNAGASAEARISHSAQLLSQLVQRGRSALGLSAILSGNCMVFSRASVEKLSWRTSTGRHNSDDGELNFRCHLNDIPVAYGSDLGLLNDLPTDARSVRLQRRRWFVAYIEALPYVGPLLRKALTGNLKALEGLFTLVFLPGCSLLFVLGALGTGALSLASLSHPRLGVWAAALAGLWALHILYYFTALQTVGGFLRREDFKRLPIYLGMRFVALWEGAVLGSRRDPGRHSIPSAHPEDAAQRDEERL